MAGLVLPLGTYSTGVTGVWRDKISCFSNFFAQIHLCSINDARLRPCILFQQSISQISLAIFPLTLLILKFLHHLIFIMGWFWAEPTPLAAARTPSGHPPVVGDKAPPVCNLSPINMAYDFLSNSFF